MDMRTTVSAACGWNHALALNSTAISMLESSRERHHSTCRLLASDGVNDRWNWNITQPSRFFCKRMPSSMANRDTVVHAVLLQRYSCSGRAFEQLTLRQNEMEYTPLWPV